MTESGNRVAQVDAGVLHAFCLQILRRLGVPDEDARIAADVLVEADLRGIETHGLARLRGFYVAQLKSGAMSPCPNVRTLHDTPVTAVLDGGSGLGPPIAWRAMTLALDKARRAGTGFVAVRNSNHFGIAGYYAMMALKRGCIGLCASSTNPWVVPTFGAEAVLGTNPIAVAVPADGPHPFVLDMATSAVTAGKIDAFSRAGASMPVGWAVDEQGRPAVDPKAVLHAVRTSSGGGLLPLGGPGEQTGGHKGYGLAMCVDIFSVLLPSGCWPDLSSHAESGPLRMGNVCHFFGAWRVDAFRPLDEFRAAVAGLLRRMKESRKAGGHDRIYVAGEKEFEESQRRRRDGIPLSPAVTADLLSLASEFNVPFDPGDPVA